MLLLMASKVATLEIFDLQLQSINHQFTLNKAELQLTILITANSSLNPRGGGGGYSGVLVTGTCEDLFGV